ncbi:MAG: potassium transporter TrkG, partial [Bacteroidota bacterium]|nr:potassium transporter TrkG [Bacteroidota bacterium]
MRLNHKIILSFLGLLLMLSGVLMALSIIPSVYFEDGVTLQLVISSAATFCSGGLLYLLNRGSSRNIGKRDGYLIVTLGWVVMSLFGSLPFLLTGSISHIPDAIFESISGFTTTGASILNDIESMPEGVLLWRSTTHWIGGMG